MHEHLNTPYFSDMNKEYKFVTHNINLELIYFI